MKTIMVLIIMLGSVAASFAQFKQGDWELRCAGNTGQVEMKIDENVLGENSQHYLFSYPNFNAQLCLGYYVFDGISVEGEFYLYAEERAIPQRYVLLNLSYTYYNPKTSVAPFVHAGLGVGNCFRTPGMQPSWLWLFNGSEFNAFTYNAGAGVKCLLSKDVAATFEWNYRIQRFYFSSEVWSKKEYRLKSMGLVFGLSFLF